MMQASRRRTLAAVISGALALALAIAVGGRGCGPDADTPEGAVRALWAAARAGDVAAAYALMGPATQARLERAAKRTNELSGGARRFAPEDLIRVGRASGLAKPVAFDEVSRDGGRAVVKVRAASGTTVYIDVVEVDGKWRVELASADGASDGQRERAPR